MPRKRRGRKKKFKIKFNIRTETIRSSVAIGLMVISGIIIISFVARGYTLNDKIQEILRQTFGYTHLLLVPIFFIAALILMNLGKKYRAAELRYLIGLSLLFFGLSGLLHTPYSEKKSYSVAKDGGAGGMFGHKIMQILSDMLSTPGAVLILGALCAVAIIVLINKPIDEIFGIFGKGLEKIGISSSFVKGLKKNKEEKEEDDEIEISSGINLDAETSEEKLDEEEIELEPSFEIVPSLAEPKHGAAPESPAEEGTISSLNPTLPYSDKVWENPPIDLLDEPPNTPVDRGDVKARAKIIEETLESFGIEAKVKDIRFGPSVTQYALEAKSGTKIAKISNLQYDLALALASPTGSVRIEAPIPGRSLIGIEVPNNNRVTVNFKTLLMSDAMKEQKNKTNIVLGLDVGGQSMVYDIAKMPHLLIAGATGSGKSVFIHSIMASILFRASPQEVKFLLLDPKRVELVHYNDIPHLLAPVVTDIDKAPSVFKWLVQEMKRRYQLLETARVRNIQAYNEKSGFQAMPYIVLIVDELAEIMIADPAAVEKSIVSLAQLARATGIHLVLALQRPSTNVITGLIKANIPCRIAFNVTSQVDSRVIIDQPGAEKLLGKGDMLFVPPDDSKPRRVQGTWVKDSEINKLVNYLKNQGVKPTFKEDMFESVADESKSVSAGGDAVDDLFEDAVDVVISEGKGSASLLQRRLSIGYSRAARILDELEAKGIVGPARGSKPREILTSGRTSFEETPLQEMSDQPISPPEIF